jgi:hypothetical protein
MDVPMGSTREEFALRMVLRSHNAASKDVTTELRREEFVSHMALSVIDAAIWGAPNKPKKVEFLKLMERR